MRFSFKWTASCLCCVLMHQDAIAQNFPPSSRWYVREPTAQYATVDGVSQSTLMDEKVISVSVLASSPEIPVPDGATILMVSESDRVVNNGTLSLYGREGDQTVFREFVRVRYSGEVQQFPDGTGGNSLSLVSSSNNPLGFEMDVSGTRYRFFDDTSGGQYSQAEIFEASTIDKFQPNLFGYDLVWLSPWDFQEGKGQKRQVFEFQPYRKNSGGDPVPIGLEYMNRGCSMAGVSQCQTVESSAELIRKTANRVGVSAGVDYGGFKGQFAANAELEQEARNLSEGSAYYCMAYAAAASHIYFLDQRGAKLTQSFMSDALSLLNRPDRYQWFVDSYGTHYAASIVYGGRADAMTRIDRQTQEDIDSVKRCLGGQVDTSAVINLQASGNLCEQESYRLRQALARETTKWKEIGMTGGTEAAATQCQNSRSLAPVYMELRPIYELLKSPLFSGHGQLSFHAVAIANGLAQHIDRYVDEQSQRLRNLMSNNSAKQGIDQGLQGCVAKDVSHRGAANVLLRLPGAPNGHEYRLVPFLPAHGATQQLKILARCENFEWVTFDQHGHIEGGNVPPCDGGPATAPCFRYQ